MYPLVLSIFGISIIKRIGNKLTVFLKVVVTNYDEKWVIKNNLFIKSGRNTYKSYKFE